MTTIIARSAESVHWYRTDGMPQYTTQAKDGSYRPTTMRDARKFNLVPSVTTILKVIAKPGLDVWKNEQLLLAAMTLPRRPEESEKEFIARIVADSKQTAKQAAERGTRIHESIEAWFEGIRPVEHPEIAQAFEIEVNKHFQLKDNDWICEASFSNTHGYGGKIDLYCDPNKQAPHGIVIDTKTKEFKDGDEIIGYDEHLMQLAAYRYGLGLTRARCANVYASSTQPGVIKILEWEEEELLRGWEMFLNLLNYWKLKNQFGAEYAK